jgi:hypothetical protein
MPAEVIAFLDWVARATGIILLLAAPVGFVFREKWKQMLQRSLVQDMEQIKHGFHRSLEAYTVTLIAEAEAAKAKGYAEIEFERLVELEQIITPLTFKVLTYAKCDPCSKTNEQLARVLEKSDVLYRDVELAGNFKTLQEERKFMEHRKLLQGVITYQP